VDAQDAPELARRIAAEIAAQGGWLGFERFMELALYAPGLGYYARGDRQFGLMPASGSDFVTAPQLSPLFGTTLARQVAQALLRWLDALPPRFCGVVLGNEVLDAMPVMLLHFDGRQWWERGVCVSVGVKGGRFQWSDRPTLARPPLEAAHVPGTVTELGRHATGFMRTLAGGLERGAAFFIDYGFPEAEYYHPQRHGGTLMCHRAHRADTDPLVDVGDKDITAHVDFSAVALAGQEAGLTVLGYTSQARFLLNCGLLEGLAAGRQDGRQAADLRTTSLAHKLLAEHEMGELFKVIGFAAGGLEFDALGFAVGDRTHTL
jgi:SAM-dependent MidA family methyltransferase